MSVVARKIVNPEPMPPKSRKPHLPTPKEIWKQARHDWFGKDVQETPTVSYVWTADQFGHVGLGFQITFLFAGLALLSNLSTPWTLTIAAAVNFAIWVTKEIYDYIRERKKATTAESVFPFNGKEILWNVFTALFYILVGAIGAGAIPFGVWSPLVTLVILLLPAALLGLWWLRRKIVFQQAGLPYLYRLANFPVPSPPSISSRPCATQRNRVHAIWWSAASRIPANPVLRPVSAPSSHSVVESAATPHSRSCWS